jgi:hypothetical protein
VDKIEIFIKNSLLLVTTKVYNNGKKLTTKVLKNHAFSIAMQHYENLKTAP